MAATKEPINKEMLEIREQRSESSEKEKTNNKCAPPSNNHQKSLKRKLKLIPVDIPPYHTKPIADIFTEFNVTSEGIDPVDEAKRVQKYGKNELRGDSGVSKF